MADGSCTGGRTLLQQWEAATTWRSRQIWNRRRPRSGERQAAITAKVDGVLWSDICVAIETDGKLKGSVTHQSQGVGRVLGTHRTAYARALLRDGFHPFSVVRYHFGRHNSRHGRRKPECLLGG